ncbi:MAG: PRC-barrel domain-containing protein [Candidatus Gracilibacteria bacterium]|nr:PRC-barrel domain-containing protein [Candidatus Gracilibacteria bacterium]
MLKLHSNLEDMKVISFQSEKALAVFEDLIVRASSAQVIGMLVTQKSFLKSTRKLIVLPDILEISNAIYVQNDDAILSTDEIVRLRELEKERFSLINLPVESRSGEKIGQITDYVFDTLTGQIMKFHSSPRLLGFNQTERIIATEQVYELTKDKLIVQDGQEKIQSKLESLLTIQNEFGSERGFSVKLQTKP